MPRWSDLKRYCKRNNWVCIRKTKHIFYVKVLPDGTILKTKISHGSGEIDPGLWRNILKHELRITQEEFNAGL